MNLSKWGELNEKTNNLTLRERGILAGTVIVVVVVAWLQFYFTAYEKQAKQLTTQKSALLKDKVVQSQSLAELTITLDNDPNKQLREDQKQIQAELNTLKKEIESRLSNLIAPEKMADVMKLVLSDYKGLKLLSARNLDVKPLTLGSSSANSDALTPSNAQQHASNNEVTSVTDQEQAVIFAHGFEMVLRGGYFQTIEFLQHLESMTGFYWQKLDYQVKEYPLAEITVQISTLSLEEDWIGV